MRTVLFLTDDYWHKADTIKPLADILFPAEEWNLCFTKDPEALFTCPDPALLISFKDPIENDQIPTPVWCDSRWTDEVMKKIRNGLGFIAVHAAVTDLEISHPIVKELIHSVFLNHPPQCEVSIHVLKEHPVTKGVNDFVLPLPDEHYQMQMTEETGVDILAETVSQHGAQPGLWVSEYGKGRICCFTPGHTTQSLTCKRYVQIMKNAVDWCCLESMQTAAYLQKRR